MKNMGVSCKFTLKSYHVPIILGWQSQEPRPGSHAFCKDPTQVTTEAAAMLRWRQRSSKDSWGDGGTGPKMAGDLGFLSFVWILFDSKSEGLPPETVEVFLDPPLGGSSHES